MRAAIVAAMTTAFGVLVVVAAPAVAAAQEQPAPPSNPDGRSWLVPIPTGCDAPALPDLVFVGTLLQTGTPSGAPAEEAYDTGRFQIEQARAGVAERYAAEGVVDVRYGTDAKFLDAGDRYLVGAGLDEEAGVLVSKVRLPEPAFGGDEVIGAAESDVTCPVLDDPVRTLRVDGTSVDTGVISPLTGSSRGILRSLLLPLGVAVAVVFALAALRWVLTGVGKGVGAVVQTATVPREKLAAMRSRPRVTDDL